MNIAALLSELRKRDIELSVEGDRLRCNAPVGALTPELKSELGAHKREILEFLRSAAALASQPRAIVPLQPGGAQPPVFAVPGHNGDIFCYRDLARHLGAEQPFFALQPPGLDGRSRPLEDVEQLAAHFAAEIRAFHPGPCVIAGFCAGGAIAFELARQLRDSGASILLLGMFGCPHPHYFRFGPQLRERLSKLTGRFVRHVRALTALPRLRAYVTERLRARGARRLAQSVAARDPALALRRRVEIATLAAVRRYVPRSFAGPVCLLLPSPEWDSSLPVDALLWRTVATRIQVGCGPDGCTGNDMLHEPNVGVFAELFKQALEMAILLL